jgi:hypothetical protein
MNGMVRAAPALVLALSLALAGCSTVGPMEAGAPAMPAGVTPIAFEGFAGAVPQAVGDRVAGELARAGVASSFALVPPGHGAAAYTLRGFIAPRPEGGTTAVAHVWDVYDRQGRMVRRLAGETRVSGASADGWSAMGDSGARAVADDAAGAIRRFLVEPRGAATPLAAAPAPAPVQRVAQAQAPSGERRRAAIGPVAGLDAPAADALRGHMRRALGELGYVVSDGREADVTLSADATLNPAENGRRRLALVWNVTDARGAPLGEIRQMATLAEGAAAGAAATALGRSVDAALPGLVAIAPPRL